ncbi:MAG: hypothetical protein ACLVLH_18330 [Eisenbergiella massiliensis]
MAWGKSHSRVRLRNSGIEVKDITLFRHIIDEDISGIYDGILLPSYEEMKADKKICRQL